MEEGGCMASPRDPVELPLGWTVAEIRDKNLNKLSGGHGKTGIQRPSDVLIGDRIDATDAQLARGYKVLLRYDDPEDAKPKFRVVVRASSRAKLKRYIDLVIGDVSPV